MNAHPIESWTPQRMRELMLRVDQRDFPANLEHLWDVEQERYIETCRRIPPAVSTESRILDLGSSRPWLPFIQVILGFRQIVLNTSYPDSHFVDDGLTIRGEPDADVRVSVFDVERERFPHEDDSFDVVLCLEVLEHLAIDPMAMMAEINRVLKPGGTLVLSTPNAVRYRNVVNMLLGEHPAGWTPFNGYDHNRHNREYTAAEIDLLLRAAGLTPGEITTFGNKPQSRRRQVMQGLVRMALRPVPGCPPSWRNDTILATGCKTSTRIDRRPSWLYFDPAEYAHVATTQ